MTVSDWPNLNRIRYLPTSIPGKTGSYRQFRLCFPDWISTTIETLEDTNIQTLFQPIQQRKIKSITREIQRGEKQCPHNDSVMLDINMFQLAVRSLLTECNHYSLSKFYIRNFAAFIHVNNSIPFKTIYCGCTFSISK